MNSPDPKILELERLIEARVNHARGCGFFIGVAVGITAAVVAGGAFFLFYRG